MRARSLTAVLLCLIVAAANPQGPLARPVTVGITGGPVFLTGTGSEFWNTGLRIGAHGLYRIVPFLAIGGCLAYYRSAPDEDALIKDLDYPGFEWDVTGALSIMEIAPVVRFFAFTEEKPVQPFAQLGVGLYLLDGETTIEVSYAGEKETFHDERSENKVGMSLGVGMRFHFFEILPAFTIVATEDESTKYYSVSAGASFAF